MNESSEIPRSSNFKPCHPQLCRQLPVELRWRQQSLIRVRRKVVATLTYSATSAWFHDTRSRRRKTKELNRPLRRFSVRCPGGHTLATSRPCAITRPVEKYRAQANAAPRRRLSPFAAVAGALKDRSGTNLGTTPQTF